MASFPKLSHANPTHRHCPTPLELLQRPPRRRGSYGDYVEQLTYLLFLKMADEQEHELGKASAIPDELGWRRADEIMQRGIVAQISPRHAARLLKRGTLSPT